MTVVSDDKVSRDLVFVMGACPLLSIWTNDISFINIMLITFTALMILFTTFYTFDVLRERNRA